MSRFQTLVVAVLVVSVGAFGYQLGRSEADEARRTELAHQRVRFEEEMCSRANALEHNQKLVASAKAEAAKWQASAKAEAAEATLWGRENRNLLREIGLERDLTAAIAAVAAAIGRNDQADTAVAVYRVEQTLFAQGRTEKMAEAAEFRRQINQEKDWREPAVRFVATFK